MRVSSRDNQRMKAGLGALLQRLSWSSLPAALLGAGIAYVSGPVVDFFAGPWGLLLFFTGPGLLLGLVWGARALLRRFPSRSGWILGFSGALLIGLSIQILHLVWLIIDDLFLSGWSPC